MIEQIILDYDTSPEVLSYNSLINYKGRKRFRDVKSVEAKVNTKDLTLSFLGPMFPNLERLRLNNSTISSIRDIGCNFPKLRFLSLAQCNITSLDGIATISPNLTELYLAGNKIPDLIDLMGMNQLKIIDLEDNGISNFSTIEILQLCDKLSSLTLKSNPIAIDPNYRKKVFQLLPKLSYLDETRPNAAIPVRPPQTANPNANKEANKLPIQQASQNKQNVQQNKQNLQQKQQKVQAPQQNKQSVQNNQQSKQQPQSNPQTANQTKQQAQQKVTPSKQTTQQQSKQFTQTNQQKDVQTAKQSSTTTNNAMQNKKRAPSAAAAENAKKAIQSRQPTNDTPKKKVEMPSQPSQSPRKIQKPPTPDNSEKIDKKSASRLVERNPRNSAAAATRKSRPNTKLLVSKQNSSAPSTPTKEPQKSENKPPKPPPKPLPETVDPYELFPSSVSPHARQMSNHSSSKKDGDENEVQFVDVKKPFNRTGTVSSARKIKRNDRSAKNGDEIMTDMIQDMIEKDADESRHNKANLYERSAFPELNSINVKKKANKNVKNPEIIKPLSARGPLYI